MVLQFEIYQGWAAWYFPVGLRIVALLILPFRFWPALLIAGPLGGNTHHIIWYDFPISHLSKTITDIYSSGNTYATIALAYAKYTLRGRSITTLKALIIVLVTCFIYRGIRSFYLVGLGVNKSKYFYANIPEERLFEIILNHLLGGMVGILTLVPVGYLVFEAWKIRHNIQWRKVLVATQQMLLFIAVAATIYINQPKTLYLIRMLAIIPLIWFAYRYGWFGAIGSLLVINLLLMANVYGLNQAEALIDQQMYIISYALTGMLIGALINEQKQANRSLSNQNELLDKTNLELRQLTQKAQYLASRAVTLQEQERKHLSQELHDEVGQSITALKTEMKVLELKLAQTTDNKLFSKVQSVSDQIYDSVYSVLNWLRPRVLDDLGLKQCIEGNYLSSRLAAAGIQYQSQIFGDIGKLNEAAQTTILRICQEAVTNTIKYSHASNLFINLNIQDDVTLIIKDNGTGLPTEQTEHQQGGFGLQNIQDRVISLGGTCQFSNQTGCQIYVCLPLNNKNPLE